MLLDKDTLWADSLAHNGTPTTLNLGNAKSGPGQPIKCFISVEAALTGCTGAIFLHDADGDADEPLMTLDESIFAAVGTYEFYLPASCKQYVVIDLEGTTSAGVYSAGIVSDVQTNV